MSTSTTRVALRPTALLEAGALFSLTLLFYALTLAPSVLWGDSAHLQRMVALGVLDGDGAGRALWFAAARLMLRLPFGDPAFRVNALSALCGALTVVLVYTTGLTADLSRRGALVASVALAVSHTFWQQAVRAEVYTPFMALLTVEIWLWFKWQPGRIAQPAAAVALWAALILAHQMAVLVAPALLFLCVLRWRWLRPAQWAVVGITAVGAVVLVLFALQRQTQLPPAQAVLLYLTHSGTDFGPKFFDFSWSSLPKDTILFVVFLLLQFPGPALLLGLFASVMLLRRSRLDGAWRALLVLALTDGAFALAYRVPDRYVFFLPMYLVFALFAGLGWDEVERRWQPLKKTGVWWIALLLLILTPIAAYGSATALAQRLAINPLDVRVLPGRDPNRFFLWPAANGYDGAAGYARAALSAVPPGGVLLADFTPYEALRYAQLVGGLGANVDLVQVDAGSDLAALVQTIPPKTQIFLADDDPRYYDLSSIPNAVLEPAGPIYHLQR